jgi:hypothetical protein
LILRIQNATRREAEEHVDHDEDDAEGESVFVHEVFVESDETGGDHNIEHRDQDDV